MKLAPAARRLHLPAVGLTAALTLALVACDQPATITKYETPRVEPRATAVDLDKERARLDHMFAAIVPAGDSAWFFKLVVPAPAAQDMRKPFDDFLASVNAAPDAELPSWTLAEGWTQQPGDAMRAATIVLPHGDDKFELTVTKLPLTDDWDAYVKENVGRWMKQLQQEPLTSATIKKLARTLPTKGKDATAFELVGIMQRNPMGMLGGMPAGHPPLGAEAPPSSATPPAGAEGGARAAPSGEFAYTAPEGWGPGPASSMRKASFAIAAAGGKADVSVTAFPAKLEMDDPRANALRWAGEVGLANMSDAEIAAATTKTEIAGQPATRFEAFSPSDAPGALGTLAAMTVRGDQVWFFKLKGDKTIVEAQRDAFGKFLDSVKFPAER